MNIFKGLPPLLLITSLLVESTSSVEAQQTSVKPTFEQVKEINEESLMRINQSTGKSYLAEWSENAIIRDTAKREGPNYKFDLRICQDAGYWHGIDYKTNYDLYGASSLLTQIEMYRYFFGKLGIPQAVWAPSLIRLEAIAKKNYGLEGSKPPQTIPDDTEVDRLLGELASKLNQYLISNGQSAQFAVVGMCGAGESYIKVRLAPPGPAQIAYIPAYQWKLCKAQGLNPYDKTKCPNWRNMSASNEVTEFWSGLYYFDVKWTSGKSTYRGPYQLKPSEKVISISPNDN